MSFSLLGRTNAKEVCMKKIVRTSLLEYANANREEGNFNDIEICVGSDRIPCNRMVLSCFSLFFEGMFKSEMKEKYQKSAKIDGIDGITMISIIKYIYSGEIKVNDENVCKLLSAADYLQIEDVRNFCVDFIHEAVTPKNSFLVLEIAQRYGNTKLNTKVMKTVGENFDEASATEEFKRFTEVELVNCISKLKKNQVTEASKYNAIIGWTKHHTGKRVGRLVKLLELVDLYKLPMDFLQSVILKEDLVLQNLELCKIILNIQSEHINRLSTKGSESKLISLGGNKTRSNVAEVFSCADSPPKIYPAIPESRYCGQAIILHDHLYYIGGKDKDKRETNTVWRMNLKENKLKWEEVCSMNKKRSVMGAAVFKGNLVVVGSGGEVSAESYSTLFNSWTPLHPLQQPREGNSLVVCNNRFYAIGGYGNGQCLSSVECLSSGRGKWEYVKSMQTPRKWLAAVNCNGLVYAIGGESNDERTRLKSVEKYDPCKDKWTFVAEMKYARVGFAACVSQRKIFVVGGMNDKGKVVRKVECYDPIFGEWSIVGETVEELLNHSVVVV